MLTFSLYQFSCNLTGSTLPQLLPQNENMAPLKMVIIENKADGGRRNSDKHTLKHCLIGAQQVVKSV